MKRLNRLEHISHANLTIRALYKQFGKDFVVFGSFPRSEHMRSMGKGEFADFNAEVDIVTTRPELVTQLAVIANSPSLAQIPSNAKGTNTTATSIELLEARSPVAFTGEDTDESDDIDEEWDKFVKSLQSKKKDITLAPEGWQFLHSNGSIYRPQFIHSDGLQSRWNVISTIPSIRGSIRYDVGVIDPDVAPLEYLAKLRDEIGDYSANFAGIYDDDLIPVHPESLNDIKNGTLRRIRSRCDKNRRDSQARILNSLGFSGADSEKLKPGLYDDVLIKIKAPTTITSFVDTSVSIDDGPEEEWEDDWYDPDSMNLTQLLSGEAIKNIWEGNPEYLSKLLGMPEDWPDYVRLATTSSLLVLDSQITSSMIWEGFNQGHSPTYKSLWNTYVEPILPDEYKGRFPNHVPIVPPSAVYSATSSSFTLTTGAS